MRPRHVLGMGGAFAYYLLSYITGFFWTEIISLFRTTWEIIPHSKNSGAFFKAIERETFFKKQKSENLKRIFEQLRLYFCVLTVT